MNKDNFENLLEKSKTFCMAPWVHTYLNPVGKNAPCCISSKYIKPKSSFNLDDLVNSDEIKQLRLDMINDIPNEYCKTCYSHEEQNIGSSRQTYNQRFGKHIENVLGNTQSDGHLLHFQMKYFDMRFSNICNFKCRTCNSEYSSLWEQEESSQRKHRIIKIKPNDTFLTNEIFPQIEFIEIAYFAGGEPFITEEHYLLLEEMIKQKRTDIKLQYNSNISNLNYKHKDLIKLWSYFTNPIEVWASIDHIKEKAEYIRHGTDWNRVEKNLIQLSKTKNVKLSTNTVVSIFNYLTLDDLYYHLVNLGVINPNGAVFGAYCMDQPYYFNSQGLPNNLKNLANQRITKLINYFKLSRFSRYHIQVIEQLLHWTDSKDKWADIKTDFQNEINRIDVLRNENFISIFPELKTLME